MIIKYLKEKFFLIKRFFYFLKFMTKTAKPIETAPAREPPAEGALTERA